MSDNPKEAEEKMAKAIFISGDCWLCVFDLLPLSQLGLGISTISRRFDYYVDEHFKTRKRTLKYIRIESKIGENGTKEMEIVNSARKPMPIPQIQMPRKVTGFQWISINYIDRNVIAFLRLFRQLFAVCPIHLSINTYYNDRRISEFLLRIIWPMFGKNIHSLELSATFFHHLRPFAPSILNDCSSLRFVFFYFDKLFTGFPCDDNAMESDGQSVAKWLFTPRPDNVPKVFKCGLDTDDGNWSSQIEAFKSAFASASPPVNFIAVLCFPPSFAASVMPFDLTNEMTREQLALKRTADFNNRFLLIRCPIARDESKWTKWEEEAIHWYIYDQCNKIEIRIDDERQIGDGLLDATPGPSDQK